MDQIWETSGRWVTTESQAAPSSTCPSLVTVTPETSPVRNSSGLSCVQREVLTAHACDDARRIVAQRTAAWRRFMRTESWLLSWRTGPDGSFRRPVREHRDGLLLAPGHHPAHGDRNLDDGGTLHRSRVPRLGRGAQHADDGRRRLRDLSSVDGESARLAIDLHEHLIPSPLPAQEPEKMFEALGLERVGGAVALPLVRFGPVAHADGEVAGRGRRRNADRHAAGLGSLPRRLQGKLPLDPLPGSDPWGIHPDR